MQTLSQLPSEPLNKSINANITLNRTVPVSERQDELVTMNIKELGGTQVQVVISNLAPIVELKQHQPPIENQRLLAKGKICNLTVYDCKTTMLTLSRK